MKKEIFILFAIIIFTACAKNDKNVAVLKPGVAILSAPVQNSVCTSGTIISPTMSTIAFTWNASDNTTNYNLVLKNLSTSDSIVQNTTQTQASINLLRGTPYSWYVISKSNVTTFTARSTTWKFYNSGPGVVTYAPFPAEITSPIYAQSVSATSGTVNLIWTGSIVVPDAIANYDVYFGSTNSPGVKAAAIKNSFLNNVAVTANTTYYWRVVTRDIYGNTSDSGIYIFTVN